MKKYYTRVCNFAYGKSSIKLVKKKKNLPLNVHQQVGNLLITELSHGTQKKKLILGI